MKKESTVFLLKYSMYQHLKLIKITQQCPLLAMTQT